MTSIPIVCPSLLLRPDPHDLAQHFSKAFALAQMRHHNLSLGLFHHLCWFWISPDLTIERIVPGV